MMEDYDKAIAPLEKALSITPQNSGILYALGKYIVSWKPKIKRWICAKSDRARSKQC
jgi:hypothetical protein